MPRFDAVDPLDATEALSERSAVVLMGQIRGVDVDVRFNRRSRQEEWRRYPKKGRWRSFEDRHRSMIFSRIADTYKRKAGNKENPYVWRGQERTDHWGRIMAARSVDPFADWLQALPEWDGDPRLDTILEDVFELAPETDPEAAAWLGRAPLVAACARTLQPGFKFDHMPTIVGPQALGKSTYWAHLLPADHRHEWFTDSFHLRMERGRKEQVEPLKGVVFGEAADFAGVTRADLAQLKTFITSQVDKLRFAYRRDEETVRRRFVLVGTADRPGVLPNDPAGLRRFPVVEVTGGDPGHLRSYLDETREQLWAEALQRARGNPRSELLMDADLQAAFAATAEKHRNKNPMVEDAIDDAIAASLEESRPIILTRVRVGKRTLGPAEVRQAATRLYACGWTKTMRRIDGKQRRCWVPLQDQFDGLEEEPEPVEQAFQPPEEPPY